MELANSARTAIRPAEMTDVVALSRLLSQASCTHSHLDWHTPVDWIGSPLFVVVPSAGLQGDGLDACMAIVPDAPPAAWIRVAAIRRDVPLMPAMEGMLSAIVPSLRRAGICLLGWLDDGNWPDHVLSALGFKEANRIITYVKNLAQLKNRPLPIGIEIRPAMKSDMARLAEIERAAFEPIWRHSEAGLEMVSRQAASFDVALVDGEVSGFQYSVKGRRARSGHLVRLTVHPERQGIGVGTALLTGLLRDFQTKCVDVVTLNTQADNVRSHRLYERFGFERTGHSVPLWILHLAGDHLSRAREKRP